ncbi:hypothetical protein D3C71_836700 [compost metagenome]
MEFVGHQIRELADQVIPQPDVPDARQLMPGKYQGQVQPLPLILFPGLFGGERQQTGRDHSAIDAGLVTGGCPQHLAALARAAIVRERRLFRRQHHGGSGHRCADGKRHAHRDSRHGCISTRASSGTSDKGDGSDGHYSTLQVMRGT